MGRPDFLTSDQSHALALLGQLPSLSPFYLAGGSAVAAHLGHRVSNDLDLFGDIEESELQLVSGEVAQALNAKVVSRTNTAATLRQGGLAIDLVRYAHPLLEPPTETGHGLRIAGLRDLAAMKLSAIASRGLRRDFWDIFEIARHGMPLADMMTAYRQRFGVRESDIYHVVRALTYFDDADSDELYPRGLSEAEWSNIKAYFESEVPTAFRAI